MNQFVNLGRRIRSLRMSRDMTQADLAERVNKSRYNVSIRQQHIGNIETSKGDRLPSLTVLVAIADALETTPDNLLGITQDEKINPMQGLSQQDQTLLMIIANRLRGETQNTIAHRESLLFAIGGNNLLNYAGNEISDILSIESSL